MVVLAITALIQTTKKTIFFFGNEGYDKTQSAIEAAQNYIDEQTTVSSTHSPIKEVGSPIEDEGRTTEALNDL